MNANISIERKRMECNALPKGWQREEVLRKSGISAGKVDVYYYSPNGKRIDSKLQLARALGTAMDVSTFDFQKGKFNHHHNIPLPSVSVYRCPPAPSPNSANFGGGSGRNEGSSLSGTTIFPIPSNLSSIPSSVTITPQPGNGNTLKRKHSRSNQHNNSSGSGTLHSNTNSSGGSSSSSGSGSSNVGMSIKQQIQNQQQQFDYSRSMRTDASMVPPIRQTASIFKQPVTVVRNHDNQKTKQDPKQGALEKPKQLFWEKRLEGLRACHSDGEDFGDIVLPKGLKPLGPNIQEQTVVQSLATALHLLNTPVTGQTATKSEFQKNATAYITADQPLMQSVIVSDDDIRRQEERVNAARKKLQEALKL